MLRRGIDYRFQLGDGVSLQDGDKLFLGDVHLFDCSEAACAVMMSALDAQEKQGYFSLREILKELDGSPWQEALVDPERFLLDMFDYLDQCGVIRGRTPQYLRMFAVADNEEARRIARRAVAVDGGSHEHAHDGQYHEM